MTSTNTNPIQGFTKREHGYYFFSHLFGMDEMTIDLNKKQYSVFKIEDLAGFGNVNLLVHISEDFEPLTRAKLSFKGHLNWYKGVPVIIAGKGPDLIEIDPEVLNFKDKHNLAGDLANIDAVLSR